MIKSTVRKRRKKEAARQAEQKRWVFWMHAYHYGMASLPLVLLILMLIRQWIDATESPGLWSSVGLW